MEKGIDVLGLSCSPRKDGNTALMLDAVLAGAESAGALVEKIHVPSLDIKPCKACNACFERGRCIQQDDMQILYPRLLGWEIIILAAPIFSMNLAAQAKILIDRLQCLWATKFVLHRHTTDESIRGKRRGLWLSAAGHPRETVFEPPLVTVRYFFDMLEIGNWNQVTINRLDEKGAVRTVPGALERCREQGIAAVNRYKEHSRQ